MHLGFLIFNPTWICLVLCYEFILFYHLFEMKIAYLGLYVFSLLAVRRLLLWLHIWFSVFVWKSTWFMQQCPPQPAPPWYEHVLGAIWTGVHRKRLYSFCICSSQMSPCALGPFGPWFSINPEKRHYSILRRGSTGLSKLLPLPTASLQGKGRTEVQIQPSSLWNPQNPLLHSTSSALGGRGAGGPWSLLPARREGPIWPQILAGAERSSDPIFPCRKGRCL